VKHHAATEGLNALDSQKGRIYLARRGAHGRISALGATNMRVLLGEARLLARNLAYHRRAKLEARFDLVLNEMERQIEPLRRVD
jgi:hypothetical protein